MYRLINTSVPSDFAGRGGSRYGGSVIRSTLPLRVVETKFSPDSTGFSKSKFARWYDEKYGIEPKKAEWVKSHIVTGGKANVVCACEITDQHDSPVFSSLH